MRMDFTIICIISLVTAAIMPLFTIMEYYLFFLSFLFSTMGLIFLVMGVILGVDCPRYGWYGYPPSPPPVYYTQCPYCRTPMQWYMGRYWCPRCQRYV